MNSSKTEWYCFLLSLFHKLSMTPNVMWITPKIRDIFILYVLRNPILFVADCHTGSTPKGYGSLLYMLGFLGSSMTGLANARGVVSLALKVRLVDQWEPNMLNDLEKMSLYISPV